MPDEQVVRLLQEIRDLQKESVANQEISLKNQREAAERQKAALQRSKVAFVGFIVLFCFLLAAAFALPFLTGLLNWIVRR